MYKHYFVKEKILIHKSNNNNFAVTPVSIPQPTVNVAHATTVTPSSVVTPIQPSVETIGISRENSAAAPKPNLGINRPTDIKSTVEPKSLKIPDFLQRK